MTVKCTRCRHQCPSSDWVNIPSKRFSGCTEKTCPKCGCRSYFDMTPQVAWCWASGLIEIGDQLPADAPDGGGAIEICAGPKFALKGTLAALARRGYEGQLLVPGVPEASGQRKKADALAAWLNWCAKGNGKKSSDGVVFSGGHA
ncbi:MAG: hypothetical protein CGU28_03190 [Candidatus Dactylopiibacterium carminicum]|uniref:Uncharacterized protein n=1 Tax=Candidatus Dactylopiibacterium carminicum TaxID=857335 RepID=A0A272EYK6_9RHOO|nr:hypothetical protein BGI27_01635 [Candidatus Dactylopiibacterium carminicum]PAS95214.1 MAG: hypothetical protein CGU29_01530 [Candidatus Dactylopiibacterium carminicum]PAS97990.1 MAG: hypothetical protein CGU28_03190 [Candidatus Dactylopiibacterium carminicum]